MYPPKTQRVLWHKYREGNVQTEQREMQPQAKECHQPPEAKTRDEFSRASIGSTALPAPWFWASDLQNYAKTSFCCFKPLPQETKHFTYDMMQKWF